MFKPTSWRPLRARRSSVAQEEEAVWVAFYRRIADPAIAIEVLGHLDADAERKRMHPALYLACKESVRQCKARALRRKRVRGLLRTMCRAFVRDNKVRRPAPRPHADRVPLEPIVRVTSRDAPAPPAHAPHSDVAPPPSVKAA